MQRLRTQQHAEALSVSLALYPPRMRERLTFDLFEGDPIFAGLHGITDTNDGRSYRDTAHTCYPWHTRDKRTTIVLPEPRYVPTLVHELAHVLDWSLDFDVQVEAVTNYAANDRYEAFAEWITALLLPSYLPWGADQAWSELAKGDQGKRIIADLMDRGEGRIL